MDQLIGQPKTRLMTNDNLNLLPNVPWLESPFFKQIFTEDKYSTEALRIAKSLHEDGYAIFNFPEPDLDNVIKNLQQELHDLYDWDKINQGINERVQDVWNVSNAVKQIATNQSVLDLLTSLYGKKAIPFQTMNFANGTEQAIHTDAVHFHSIPERYMCAVWVAFEDVDEENGPLFFVPKSHKLPIYLNEHIGKLPDIDNPYTYYNHYDKLWNEFVKIYDLKTEYFYAKKGQALIWTTNLLHGGAYQKDKKRSRHSQVTHYMFENCTCYTPLWSVESLGIMHHREIIDIGTGEKISSSINGKKLDPDYLKCVSLHGNRVKQILRD